MNLVKINSQIHFNDTITDILRKTNTIMFNVTADLWTPK